jgi:hypothetical protein
MMHMLPLGLRARLVLRFARQMVGATYPGSRATGKLRRGTIVFDIRGSVFCEVREVVRYPLCGYYASAVTRMFELFDVPVKTELSGCRAIGGRACHVSVAVCPPQLERDTAVAA